MTGTTAQKPSGEDGTELPRPRHGSRWRWSRPHQALVASGALAAVLGLGVATGVSAGAATTTPGNTGAAAPGRPPGGGMARPTVSGRITALSGDDITLETNAKTTVTVVYSSGTTFKADPGPGGGTASRAAALKIGDFIGAQGTKNGDGSVTASSVTIGRPQQMGQGAGPGQGGKPPRGGAPRA
jgi:Domain of unknown function (DUF5666)